MGKIFRNIETIVERAAIVLAVGAGIAVFAMMTGTTADFIGRGAFNSPIKGTYEINEIYMACVVFFGIAYAQLTKAHIRVKFLFSRLSHKQQSVLHIVNLAIFLGLYIIFTFVTAQHTYIAFQTQTYRMGTTYMPLWPSKILLPIGGIVLCALLAVEIVRAIQLRGGANTTSSTNN